MSKVFLGDVAVERRETCKGSKDGYPIVGLEHLTPEEITLSKAHGGVGLRHITKAELEKIEFLLPPMPKQLQYAAFVRQSDKSKFELEQALSELTATYKRIITETFV